MVIKSKYAGSIGDVAPFVKRDSVYAAAVASVKAGGVYSLVSGEIDPAAPSITGSPTISGIGEVGQTLTATPATMTGNPAPEVFYGWFTGDPLDIEAAEDVVGGSGLTLVLTAAQAGLSVFFGQAASSELGSAFAVSNAINVAAVT